MHHDVLIVGGGFAGLSAASVLARARRRVLVVDAGAPRNRFSSHAHNIIGHDGRSGADILADARAQLGAYPSAELWSGEVKSVRAEGEGFAAALADGREIEARRILLATGVTDTLPNIPGLAERWGKSVLHCPYCHGFEVAGQRIGVLAANAHAAQHAGLIAEWGEVTLFANGVAFDDEARAFAAARGVTIVEGKLEAIEGAAPAIEAIRLESGARVQVAVLFIPVSAQPSALTHQLGCAFEEAPGGPFVRVDAMKRAAPGVYAAGDAARGMHAIAFAAADGMMAGVALHRDLIGLG